MIQNFSCSSWCSTGHEVISKKIISTYRMSVFQQLIRSGGATGVSVMGSHGKYQTGGGGQRYALLLFCDKSPKLGNGGPGKYLLGKVELVMIFGAVCWRASALLLPVGLSDADGNARTVFWNSLCLFSHFSLFEDGLFLNISRSWEGLLHGSCISGRWDAMGGVVHLAWALFASISEELCFWEAV
ncbi:hypothetical protein CDEST_06287 [Colletotrichum destructivum]|uniref:Uncharacterized protein n=1 Tax=Colletotrichum destructivum TaxID=34406 RepID=A0AAX4ID08_9PEZI|nr:hypothetical protein CDEST_06287 [Colletotrichum destructivum]